MQDTVSQFRAVNWNYPTHPFLERLLLKLLLRSYVQALKQNRSQEAFHCPAMEGKGHLVA